LLLEALELEAGRLSILGVLAGAQYLPAIDTGIMGLELAAPDLAAPDTFEPAQITNLRRGSGAARQRGSRGEKK
jgi:hypothetical protein